MELFASPLTCSFAVHVACLEAGVPFSLRHVVRKTKRLDDGGDYRDLAPQGIVPSIRLPDGSILTETSAVLQYVADRAPESGLAPAWGTVERYRLVEWLHFVSTELHKKHLFPTFADESPDAVREYARSSAQRTLDHVERRLAAGGPFAMGERFTVADAYLFWALLVAPYGGVSLDGRPAIAAYVERVRARPSVKAVLAKELPLYVADSGGPPRVATATASASA